MPSGWIDPSRRASVRSYGPHANVKRSLLIGSFLAQSHRNYLKQKSSRAANAGCSLPRLRGRGGGGGPPRRGGGGGGGGGVPKGLIMLRPLPVPPPQAEEGTMWHRPCERFTHAICSASRRLWISEVRSKKARASLGSSAVRR